MESFAESLIDYILTAGIATFTQLLIFLGPGLILAALNHLLAHQVWNSAIAVMGWNRFAYTLAIIGIPIHEIGHALLHLLFGHTITDIGFFEPDNPNHSGHVSYTYNPDSIYQRIGIFFGAIGPILLGSLVLYLAAIFLVGDWLFEPAKALDITSQSFNSFSNVQRLFADIYSAGLAMLGSLFRFENLSDWKFYVFVYLAFSVGISISLSSKDLENAAKSFVYILFILFVFNLFTIWIGDFAVRYMGLASKYFGVFYSILVFAMVLNLVALAVFSTLRLLLLARRAV